MIGGPSSSYNKLWAVGSEHTIPSPPAESLPASHFILESLRKKRGAETAEWLNSLTGTNQTAAIAGSASAAPTNEYEHQLLQWLDKLFDQFELYAARFNNTAQGTDLIITCTRAGQTNNHADETVNNNLAEKIYEGHLVTRFWAMLLRGTVEAISVFIFPAEVLLGFSLHKIDESPYSPLLVIESCWQDNQLAWHIGGTCITQNQIPLLAKELFGDLIRVASGKMSESELFAHPLQELNLGETLAVGYKVPPCADKESIAQPVSVGKNPAPPVTASKTLSLSSLALGEKMLTSIDSDINQLFQLGKTALTSEDTLTFKKIELLTEKMEALKEAVRTAFAEVTKLL